MKSTSSDGSNSVTTFETNCGTSSAMVEPMALTSCEKAKRAYTILSGILMQYTTAHRVTDYALCFHDIQCLEKRLSHLLEGWLIRHIFQLSIGSLRKALGEVAKRHEVVVDFEHSLKIFRRFAIPFQA